MAQDPTSDEYLDDLARRVYGSGSFQPQTAKDEELDDLARRVFERKQSGASGFERVKPSGVAPPDIGEKLSEIPAAFAGGAIEAQAGASLGADMEGHMSFMSEWNRAREDAYRAVDEELKGVPWWEQTQAASRTQRGTSFLGFDIRSPQEQRVSLRDPRFMTEEELAAEQAELAAIEQNQVKSKLAVEEKFKQFAVDRGLMGRQYEYLRDVNEQRDKEGKPRLGDFDLVPTDEWLNARTKFAAEAADIVSRNRRLEGSLFSTIPGALGSSVPILAEAAAASAIASPIGGVAGTVLRGPARALNIVGSTGAAEAIVGTASRVASAQTGSLMQMSGAYQEAMDFTKGDHGKALEYAMATKPAGFLEAIPIGEQMARAFGRINRRTDGRFWEYLKRSETLKQLASEGAFEGGEEVIQEGLQASWQEEAKRAILEEPEFIPVWKKFLAEGAIPSFFAGFLTSVLSSGVAEFRARRGAAAVEPEKAPTEEEISAEAAKIEEEAAPTPEKKAGELPADFVPFKVAGEVGLPEDWTPFKPEAAPAAAEAPAAPAEGVTPEAAELVSKVDEGGGVPAMVTKRLEKIAADNGIEVTGSMTPQDVVDILRAKRDLAAAPAAEVPTPAAAAPMAPVAAPKPPARKFKPTPVTTKSVGQMPSAQIESLLSGPLDEREYNLLRQQAVRRGIPVPERVAPAEIAEPVAPLPAPIEAAPVAEVRPAEAPSEPAPVAPAAELPAAKRASDMTDDELGAALAGMGTLTEAEASELRFEADMRGIEMPAPPAPPTPPAPQAPQAPQAPTVAPTVAPLPKVQFESKESRPPLAKGPTAPGMEPSLKPTPAAPSVEAKPEPAADPREELLRTLDAPPPPTAPSPETPNVVPVEELPKALPQPSLESAAPAKVGSRESSAVLQKVGLDATVLGDSVAFSGKNTFLYKETLKSFGGRWNGNTKSWVLPRDGADKFVAELYAKNRPDFSLRDAVDKGDASKPVAKGRLVLSSDPVVAEAQRTLKGLDIASTVNDESGVVRMTGQTWNYADEISQYGGERSNEDGDWRITKSGLLGFVQQLKSDAEKARAEQIAKRDSLFRAQREQHGGTTLEGSGPGGLRRPAVEIVGVDTQELLNRGLKFGIPADIIASQVEDTAKIVQAKEDGKRAFLLALEPGSGKTFVLGAAIRELRNRGAKNIVYVTNSNTLIGQIKEDLAAYGIDNVAFTTYTKVRSGDVMASDLLILDEAHGAKNVAAGKTGSAQAKATQEWVKRSKMTIFSTATPFENPTQAEYLNPTGIFDSAGGFDNWVQIFGGKVRAGKGKNSPSVYIWERGPNSREDAQAAQSWFVGEGVFTTRPIRLPGEMVDSRMVPVDPSTSGEVGAYQVKVFNGLSDAWLSSIEMAEKDQPSPITQNEMSTEGMVRPWIVNYKKRIVEISKIEVALSEAEKAIARGRNPIIFVETKSERDIDIGKMLALEARYMEMAASAKMEDDKMPPRGEWVESINRARKSEAEAAGREDYEEAYLPPYEVCRLLEVYKHQTNENFLTIPSSEQLVQERLKKYGVSVFTGSVSEGVAQKNLQDWRSGKNKVIVATMAKGGTGLSLHDKVGNHPTTQIVLTMPWTATKVKQVAQRNARYGLASEAEILWLYDVSNPFEMSLANKVGGRMADMGATVYGEVPREAVRLTDFSIDDTLFDGDDDSDQTGIFLESKAGTATTQAQGVISAAAEGVKPETKESPTVTVPSPDEWGPEKPRGLVGPKATIYLADQKRTVIEGEYEFVEFDDIVPSHDPKISGFPKRPGGDKNERPYDEPIVGEPEREKVYRLANEARTEFYVSNNPSSTDGPPIVAPDGRVLGGNGRAMSVELAYLYGGPQSETFKDGFVAAAQTYGVDAESVRKMRRPILIRRISFEAAGKPGELSAVLNKDHQAKKKKSVEFASRGSKIDRRAAEEISAAIGDGTLSSALQSDSSRALIVQALVRCGAFTTDELVSLTETAGANEVGPLTDEGTELLSGALLGSVIKDPGVIQIMPAEMRSKVIKLLPAMVRTRMAWSDFERVVSDAVRIVNYKRSISRAKSIADALSQQSLSMEGNAEPWRNHTRAIWLATFVEDQKLESFRSAMNSVGDAARDTLEGQASIFGSGATAEATFDDAFAPKKGRSAPPRDTQPIKIATAFSGVGTLELALSGVRSVMAVEFDPRLVAAYNEAHSTAYAPGDATAIDPKDVINSGSVYFHASPVCKNFSLAKKGRSPTDVDVRSAQSVVRVITEARPPVVTVENVPEYAKTEMFKDITDALTNAGYTWRVVKVNAADLGAPQSRSRIIVQAVLGGDLPPLPQQRDPGDWMEAVGDLIDSAPDSRVPAGEMALIEKAVKSGRIDMGRPIITMGGNKAFANSGGPAPALLSSPNMVPRIIMPDGRHKRVTPKMMLRLMSLPDDAKLPSNIFVAKQVIGNVIDGEVTRQLIQPLLDGYAQRQAEGRMAPAPDQPQAPAGTRASGWLGEAFGSAPASQRTVGNLLFDIATNDGSGYGTLAQAMFETDSDRLSQPFVLKPAGREFAPYDIKLPVEFLSSTPTSLALHEVAHVLTMNALSSEVRDVPDRMEAGEYMRVIRNVQAHGNAASAEALGASTSKERADALREGTLQLVDVYSAAWDEYLKEFGNSATHANGKVVVDRSRLQGGQLNSELSLRYTGPFNYAMSNVEEFVATANTDKSFQAWLNSKKYSGARGKFTSLWKAFVDAVAKILGVDVKRGSLLEAVLQATEQVAVAQGKAPIKPKEAKGAAKEGKQPQGGVEQRPQAGPRGPAPEAGRGDSAVAGTPQPPKQKVEKRRPENTPDGTIDNPPTELRPLSESDIPDPLSPVVDADPAFDIESYPEPDPDSIGIANARMIEQLKKIGIDADWTRMSVSDLEIWAQVMQSYKEDPRVGAALVAEFKANPAPPTPLQTAILAFEATYRFNQRDFMYGEVERDNSESNRQRLEEAEDALREIWDVTNRVGSEAGRAFRLRQLLVKRDYSLDVIKRRARAVLAEAKERLSDDEYKAELDRAMKEAEEKYKRLVESERALAREQQKAEDEFRIKSLEAEIERLVEEAKRNVTTAKTPIPPKPRTPRPTPPAGEPLPSTGSKAADALRSKVAFLAQALEMEARAKGRAAPGVPIQEDFDETMVAYAAQRRSAGLTLAQWADEALPAIGSKYESRLKGYWVRSIQAQMQAMHADVADIFSAYSSTSLVSLSKADKRKLRGKSRSYARLFIEEQLELNGVVPSTDAVLDSVMENLRQTVPDIDKELTREIISGYGDYTPPTTDEVLLTLSAVIGESREAKKLADVSRGVSPKLTGKGRPKPTDEERRLTQGWRRLAKQLGINAKSEYNVKGAQDAIKSRLTNEISDYEAAIAARQERLPQTRDVDDDEIRALREKLEDVRQRHNIMFAENIQVRDLERRVKAKRDELAKMAPAREAKEFVPTGERAKELYAELQELQRQLAEQRKNDPARRMRRLEAYMRVRIRSKKAKIAARDFKKKGRRTPEQIEADLNAKLEERRKIAAENPEYAAQLAELEELDAEAKAISAEMNPALTPEERAINQYLARKAKELVKWHQIAAQVKATGKEWVPAPKVKRELTTREQDAMIAVEKAKTEVMELNDEIERRNRSALGQLGATVGQLGAIAGALKSAADFSAVLTQGAFMTFASPKQALTYWGPYMIRASVDEQFYQRQMIGLKAYASKYFPDLEMGDVDGSLTGAETIIRSKLIERLPYIGQTIRGSNRAFMLYLNMQRVWAAKTIVNSSPIPLSADEVANLTSVINVATGRGETKELDRALVKAFKIKNKRQATNVIQFTGLALWAPKLYLSRLQLVLVPLRVAAPQAVLKGNTARARKEIIKLYVRAFLGYLALKSIAALMSMVFDEEDNLEFWDDPRSSNFGKIRFGDYVIDVLGGISQFTNLVARMTTGETIRGRKVQSLREDVAFGMTDAQGTFVQFWRAKLNPLAQFFATIATGEDAIGQEADFGDALQALITPITPGEIVNTAIEEGVGEAVLKAPIQVFGGRIQEYR